MILDRPQVAYYDFPLRAAADRQAVKDLLREVAASGEFILKRRVQEFEQQLCAQIGVAHAVCVSSGTSAIHVAIAALGAGPGDEVLTPAFSFHSSATPIALLGAKPVFVDVGKDFLVDPERIADAATQRTRGIVPVHLFSAMADMPAIASLARGSGWWVLEDSAIALGMSWDDVAAGRWGDLGLFSFHPAKPLPGVTDGAAIVTDDEELAQRCRMLRNHGQDGVTRFLHHLVGFNARMDDVNAGLLSRRLRGYREWTIVRREIARRYDEAFADLTPALCTPSTTPCERVYYTYVVRSPERDALERHLAASGIETVVYYPRPLHLQRSFAFLGHREGDFPNAERAAREALALPLYPSMPAGDVDRVVDAVRAFHGD
ncbi:MAG TPA: DegT/DnrJ/EryC1/StrS family aminotransferase [Solirubrobacteraceae bacterium]|jgi:dTDP-4-amino-4,6-dideoxygalactose transaminase|nr:DegT/DnrJ/EryC1/StrS family aminotransferase [Solirubrobacteraceae bacterium]